MQGIWSVLGDVDVLLNGKIGKDLRVIFTKDDEIRPFSHGLSMGFTGIAVFGR